MGRNAPRAFLIVLDGVGVGDAPDASSYGDEGSNTLGNLARSIGGLTLKSFQQLGLGNLQSIEGVDPVENPSASFGRLEPRSAGKDSIAGHWELCGLRTEHAFPTFPDGFPDEVVRLVEEVSGRRILGNEVASGTEIMARLGEEHVRSGRLILYTSADSVLQLLAHESVVPLGELYRICGEIHQRLRPPYRVARVIARPFTGSTGSFVRTSNRRDFALEPFAPTVLDSLQDQNIPVIGIGKVDTLFAGRGFSEAQHTRGNQEGIERILAQIRTLDRGLVFANLIDFDMLWGHRNDTEGFRRGLEELDARLPEWIDSAREQDLFILTADHGNDPTTPSTDHSRECVPLLAWFGQGGNGVDLGVRAGFYDVAATLAEYFEAPWKGPGVSFLNMLRGDG